MKNLKVWQKLALMAAVFMLPFAVVTYKMTSSINVLGVEFARAGDSRTGVLHARPGAVEGPAAAPRHDGGLAERRRVVQGAPLAAKADDIETDLKDIDEVDRRLDSALHTSTKWAALERSQPRPAGPGRRVPAADSFAGTPR